MSTEVMLSPILKLSAQLADSWLHLWVTQLTSHYRFVAKFYINFTVTSSPSLPAFPPKNYLKCKPGSKGYTFPYSFHLAKCSDYKYLCGIYCKQVDCVLQGRKSVAFISFCGDVLALQAFLHCWDSRRDLQREAKDGHELTVLVHSNSTFGWNPSSNLGGKTDGLAEIWRGGSIRCSIRSVF